VTMPDETAATIAVIEAFNAAFNAHDVDAVMALMTSDCVWDGTTPPLGERHEGADAVRAAFTAFFVASPTAHFEPEEVLGAVDRGVVRWVYTWDDGAAGSGRVRGVDVMRVRDGKIAEKLSYVKG
jgi:uncharacterized protein (TIGR02246 family)